MSKVRGSPVLTPIKYRVRCLEGSIIGNEKKIMNINYFDFLSKKREFNFLRENIIRNECT